MSEDGCVELHSHMINDDIGHYVSEQLSTRHEFQRKVFTTDIRDQIRRKVGAGANGMFRWAACQLETLVSLKSPKEVEAALNDLPLDLDETYARILQTIPENDKRDTTRLLQFLTHSNMPITVKEAVEIIATDTDVDPPSFDIKGRIADEEDVRRYGLGLISITVTTNVSGRVRREVRLAHFSVEEFLLKRPDFSQLPASIAITKTCLTYLSDITGDTAWIRRNYPFGRPAAEIWFRHGALAEKDDDIFKAIMKFLEDKETLSRWTQIYQPDGSPFVGDETFTMSRWAPNFQPKGDVAHWVFGYPTGSRLYWACTCGLARVVQALVTLGADVNARGGYLGSPLAAASASGHLDTVKLLLDNGADISARSSRGTTTALVAATRTGRKDVVRFLLQMGADANTLCFDDDGEFDGSVLLLALAAGQGTIAKLLLEKKADVTARGVTHGNALCAAAQGGCIDLMEQFLRDEFEMEVNAQGGVYGNALQAATAQGHLEAVELLLKNGADINLRGGHYGNALQAAVVQKYPEIVALFLQKGADVNIQGGIGSALGAAASNKDVELARFLVDMGADINAQGRCGTPLHTASQQGCIELMELFLERGADINARGGEYDSALQAAAYGQHIEAVKFLVEKGADVHQQGGEFGNALAAASFYGSHKNSETAKFLREAMAATEDKNGEPSSQGSGLLGNHRELSRSPKRRCYDA